MFVEKIKRTKNDSNEFSLKSIRKTTLFDNIAILTQFKKAKEIIENGGYFYGRWQKKGNFENLMHISFKELPQQEGFITSLAQLDYGYPTAIIRYLMNSPKYFYYVYFLNYLVQKLSPKHFFLYAERFLPKEKVFIKSVKVTKKDLINPKIVKYIDEFLYKELKFMRKSRIDYIDLLIQTEEIEAFFQEIYSGKMEG